MKPAAFEYVRADSADEALGALRDLGSDARILAGGQSLMAVLNMRLAQPSALIDISRTPDLDYVRKNAGMLCIGAATTQARLEWRTSLVDEVPLMAQALPFISHFQVRNRGTVCGSVAHADPSAEIPLVLTALDGRIVLRNAKRRRTLTSEDFFQGMLTTARAPDELVEEIRLPVAASEQKTAFAEFSMRHGDFAIVAVAAVSDSAGVRIAVGGVSDRPRVITVARDATGADVTAALNDFAWALEAEDDGHASAKFRRHLVRQLGARVVSQVTERVSGDGQG